MPPFNTPKLAFVHTVLPTVLLAILIVTLPATGRAQQGVAIGTQADPQQMLDVEGWIELGNETQGSVPTTGAVRYNTAGFVEFYDGTAWRSVLDGTDTDWIGAGTGALVPGNATDNVGIGTAIPTAALHVAGGFRLEDGNQQAGYVLTTDAQGNASWQPAGGTDTDWTGAGSGALVPGNSGDNVGIGTASPTAALHVAGGFRLEDGNQQAGYILTSDAQGNASWQSASGLGDNTLDDAYDEGGLGAGRLITADSGPVEIAGTDGLVSTGTFGSGGIPASGPGTRMMWYPGKAAFRVGSADGTQWEDANVGIYTFAGGRNSEANGLYTFAYGDSVIVNTIAGVSLGMRNTVTGGAGVAIGSSLIAGLPGPSMALGFTSEASGTHAFTMGFRAKALSNYCFAIGQAVEATGEHATSMGQYMKVSGDNSFGIGLFQDLISAPPQADLAQDTTFAVMGGRAGIGTVAPRTRLEVAGGFVANDSPGHNQIPATGPGTRMMWYPGKAAFRVGSVDGTQWDDANVGEYSFAAGRNSNANGIASFAFGDSCFASGSYSAAFGLKVNSQGIVSLGYGNDINITGYGSVALGSVCEVNNFGYGYTIGRRTKVTGTHSFAIGRVVEATGSNSSAYGQFIRVSGLSSFGIGLYTGQGTGGFVSADLAQDSTFAVMGGLAGFGTVTPAYRLQVGNAGDGTAARANAWLTFSDRRWKRDITPLEQPLARLENISGYTYRWKAGDTTRQLGLIAQEVQAEYPEAVSEDRDGYLSVDYSKLVPVLVEAVNVQQDSIEALQKDNARLATQHRQLESELAALKAWQAQVAVQLKALQERDPKGGQRTLTENAAN
ncbi:MAG: tail fiber domain-containing protein [Bacteroidota bacterium]